MRHCAWFKSYLAFSVFFFQAEDGIRDLVRSRGLGDVYKRQKVVGDSFGTKLYPETWFIDPKGVVRARVDGARSWLSLIHI